MSPMRPTRVAGAQVSWDTPVTEAEFLMLLRNPSAYARWAAAVRKDWTRRRDSGNTEAGAGKQPNLSPSSKRPGAAKPKRKP